MSAHAHADHGHGHGHDHDHSHTPTITKDNERKVLLSFGLIASFMVVEVVGGLWSGSLALLADAGHMLTDLVAMFMGLTAVLLARRGSASPARTYGWHRAEVFTAVANAVLLLGVAGFILYEAFERLGDAPDIPGVPMIVVALAGLIANAVVVFLLRSHSKESLAVKGAYMEVVADTVAASLKYDEVTVARSPKAKGPEAYATGPVAASEVQSEAWIAR